MAKFSYNGKTITPNFNTERLIIKYLIFNNGEVDKTISDSEFLDSLKAANYTKSTDIAVLLLKKYGFNISNESLFNEAKSYLTTCLEKSILMFDNSIKQSKINDSGYYREVNALDYNSIDESVVDPRRLYSNFNSIVNFFTNAVTSAEIIYTAENNVINTLKQQKQELQTETTMVVSDYIDNHLNLKEVLTNENPSEALLKYKKQSTQKK